MNIAVFPGSFDPFSVGHASIIDRALPLFDQIVIGVGINTEKKGLFNPEERVDMISSLYGSDNRIKVMAYSGLTTDLCKETGASYIIRGLRTATDMEYEKSVTLVNKVMSPKVETIFILTLPEHSAINSSMIKEILKYGGDISGFVPAKMQIERFINKKINRGTCRKDNV